MKQWRTMLAGAALALLLAPPAAVAQRSDTLVVDGKDWVSATQVERRAFLVGAANMIIAENAYAKKRNVAPAPVSDRLTKATDKMRIADIEARITRWYEANPGKLATPVMGVVWQDIVGKP
jgi:hypothetical protein